MPSMEISSTSRSARTRSASPDSAASAVSSAGRSAGNVSVAAAVMRQILAHGARSVHSAGVAGRPPATTRGDIEAVAFALFARNGFEETTVEEIAAAAGIGRRTFFRYFGSK